MTDLNTLIPVGSPFFLFDALSINSRRQIVGNALQTSTGEVDAFLATPSNREVASENAGPAALGATSQSPKAVLPENVRKMLQKRLTSGPRGARLMKQQ